MYGGSLTFGPVASRRFGTSLGIDLSPASKSCNFDCLYCELPAARRTETIGHPFPPEAYIEAVRKAMAKHPGIDVLTITANGEPTLYPQLDTLIDGLQSLKDGAKLMILSNGSTIVDPAVRKALARLDRVKLSLDCATGRCFKKLDRPLNTDIDAIIEGMIKFREEYAGELVIEILVVSGLNDTQEEMEALQSALLRIRPDRIDLGTVDRPPAYQVEAVAFQTLQTLLPCLRGLPVTITTRPPAPTRQSYTESELLETLSKRPFSEEDAVTLLDEPSRLRLEKLVEKGQATTKQAGEKTFYTLAR